MNFIYKEIINLKVGQIGSVWCKIVNELYWGNLEPKLFDQKFWQWTPCAPCVNVFWVMLILKRTSVFRTIPTQREFFTQCYSKPRLIKLHAKFQILVWKTLYTIGNCVRPVFSLGVSQHMRKITNQWKLELNRSSKSRDNNERKKKTLSHEVVCFQMLAFETSNSKSEVLKSNSLKVTSFSKTTLLQGSRFSQ